MALVADSARFVTGLRRLLANPVTVGEARAAVAARLAGREAAFLEMLDAAVWTVAGSPYRRLFAAAGIGPPDVARLVERDGLEGALATLRDEGVYVAYDEYQGTVPARRGSAVFELRPSDFFNPRVRGDYMGQSGGTRSAGVSFPRSFSHVRRIAESTAVNALSWDVLGAPAAVWFPALPSGAGIAAVLMWGALGMGPQRWFSQIPPSVPGIALRKRLVNELMPRAMTWTGHPLPAPELVPAGSPAPVLEWCRRAIGEHGRAAIAGYASSLVGLAQAATDAGVSLEGLVMSMAGEPVTHAKADVVRASGARPMNAYGFTPNGLVGMACPWLADDEVHVLEDAAAIVTRQRDRGDGVTVDALCVTALSPDSPAIAINLENDDYARLSVDDEPCRCEWGRLGVRRRLAGIRGSSKVVATGTTVPGEVFERLVERVLPDQFGGSSAHYQFHHVEEHGRSVLVLRVHPDRGVIEPGRVEHAVREVLRTSEEGVLAAEVWAGAGALRIERGEPIRTASGKTMPFEVHRP